MGSRASRLLLGFFAESKLSRSRVESPTKTALVTGSSKSGSMTPSIRNILPGTSRGARLPATTCMWKSRASLSSRAIATTTRGTWTQALDPRIAARTPFFASFSVRLRTPMTTHSCSSANALSGAIAARMSSSWLLSLPAMWFEGIDQGEADVPDPLHDPADLWNVARELDPLGVERGNDDPARVSTGGNNAGLDVD